MDVRSERAEAPNAEEVPGAPADEQEDLTHSRSSLFGSWRRGERLDRMSPERRAMYERIVDLREAIGPIDFDVIAAIRELRRNG